MRTLTFQCRNLVEANLGNVATMIIAGVFTLTITDGFTVIAQFGQVVGRRSGFKPATTAGLTDLLSEPERRDGRCE
jgi:hypothetical protein